MSERKRDYKGPEAHGVKKPTELPPPPPSRKLHPDECLRGTNGQIAVMGAHRYALGRRTYAAGAIADWIILWRGACEHNTICVMARDTIEALQDGEAGDDCDVLHWKRFARVMWSCLDDDGKDWVRSAIAHRGKPWPL